MKKVVLAVFAAAGIIHPVSMHGMDKKITNPLLNNNNNEVELEEKSELLEAPSEIREYIINLCINDPDLAKTFTKAHSLVLANKSLREDIFGIIVRRIKSYIAQFKTLEEKINKLTELLFPQRIAQIPINQFTAEVLITAFEGEKEILQEIVIDNILYKVGDLISHINFNSTNIDVISLSLEMQLIALEKQMTVFIKDTSFKDAQSMILTHKLLEKEAITILTKQLKNYIEPFPAKERIERVSKLLRSIPLNNFTIEMLTTAFKDDKELLSQILCDRIRTADENMVELFLKAGADIHALDYQTKHTLLAWADPKLVDYLVKKGINPNITNDDGISPLCLAINVGHLAKVQALVKNKAIITNQDIIRAVGGLLYSPNNESAFFIVKFLIENKANLNEKDSNGQTLLTQFTTGAHKIDLSPNAYNYKSNLKKYKNLEKIILLIEKYGAMQ